MEDIKINVNSSAEISQHVIASDRIFPNNNVLPVLIYTKVMSLPETGAAHLIESLFKINNWSNSWINGIYTYHHYHSTTHKVLGVSRGECMLLLGGDDGEIKNLTKGDVLIIPVGIAHKNVGASDDFECVGAYPGGGKFDINLGKTESERLLADENVKKVEIPTTDPVFGNSGPLFDFWKNKDIFPAQAEHTAAQF